MLCAAFCSGYFTGESCRNLQTRRMRWRWQESVISSALGRWAQGEGVVWPAAAAPGAYLRRGGGLTAAEGVAVSARPVQHGLALLPVRPQRLIVARASLSHGLALLPVRPQCLSVARAPLSQADHVRRESRGRAQGDHGGAAGRDHRELLHRVPRLRRCERVVYLGTQLLRKIGFS